MKQIATNNKSLKNITLKPMPDISMKPDLNETIRNMVVIVRNEIMAHKKSLDITDGALVENIITQIREENCSFSCEKECNEYYYNVVRTTLWSYVNEKESSEIINQLKSGDLLFSQNSSMEQTTTNVTSAGSVPRFLHKSSRPIM